MFKWGGGSAHVYTSWGEVTESEYQRECQAIGKKMLAERRKSSLTIEVPQQGRKAK